MADQLPAIFKQSANLPAHLMDDTEKNVIARASVNALTFEGKVWAISLDGKKTKLMKTDADGEEQPVQIFTGVVLDYNKARGRSFYTGPYDPKNPRIPDCWSEDGVRPHENVPSETKQSTTCAACLNSKKGSSQNDDGKSTTACSQFKKLAIVPMQKLGQFPPLRLTIKITSIYDKSGADSHPGWYAWDQYIDLLVSNNVHHTAKLPTKIKFDPSTSYPKLLFAPGKDWLTDEQWDIVKPLAASDETKALLADSFSPVADKTGTKPLPEDEEETELPAAPIPAQARAPKATKAPPAPAAEEDEEEAPPAPPAKPKAPKAPPVAPPAEEEEEEPDAEQIAAAKRAEAAAKAQETANKVVAKAAKKAAAPPPVEEDEGDEPPAAPVKPKAGGAKATPAKAPVAAPAAIGGLLDDWDE
jgi:hypothetical protein